MLLGSMTVIVSFLSVAVIVGVCACVEGSGVVCVKFVTLWGVSCLGYFVWVGFKFTRACSNCSVYDLTRLEDVR